MWDIITALVPWSFQINVLAIYVVWGVLSVFYRINKNKKEKGYIFSKIELEGKYFKKMNFVSCKSYAKIGSFYF